MGSKHRREWEWHTFCQCDLEAPRAGRGWQGSAI